MRQLHEESSSRFPRSQAKPPWGPPQPSIVQLVRCDVSVLGPGELLNLLAEAGELDRDTRRITYSFRTCCRSRGSKPLVGHDGHIKIAQWRLKIAQWRRVRSAERTVR